MASTFGTTNGRLARRFAAAALAAPALVAFLLAALAPQAQAAGDPALTGLSPGDPVPGELVVRMRGEGAERLIELPGGVREDAAIRSLRQNPAVASASRDYVVGVAARDDPGPAGRPGGWRKSQWHLLGGPGGINVEPAWEMLGQQGRPFGRLSRRKRGATVAIIDTGVAYRYAGRGRYRRSPDLAKGLFVGGRDFIDGDRRPLDQFGHGTHMASTIGEGILNGRGVRGIAPGARLMPVRVLDRFGLGRTSTVARGVRWAIRHGARIVNTSINFGSARKCKEIPSLCRAYRKAQRRGVLVVAAGGNEGRAPVPLPASAIVVGANTIRGCLGAYSNRGKKIDILAPGGGRDARRSGEGCKPRSRNNPGVVQLTMTPRRKRYSRFAYPRVVGTSSAAAHVSGVAALVIGSGMLGPRPKPAAVARQILQNGRPAVGLPSNSGSPPLLDAAAALGMEPAG